LIGGKFHCGDCLAVACRMVNGEYEDLDDDEDV